MKTNVYKITSIVLAFLLCNITFAQKNLLYVGVTDDPVDTYLIEYLELQGYTITFVDEDDFKLSPYDQASAYDGYDALYVSEIIGSSSVVNYKTAEFPIPCVSTEGYCVRVDRWDFITDNDTQFKQLGSADQNEDVLTLVINDVDHWIANNYPANYNLVWTTAEVGNLGVTGCKLNENVVGAVEIGRFLIDAMAEFPSIWAIPEGATLVSDGSVVLPNIVIIGVINTGLGEFATQEYNNLILNSLKWVTGDYEVINSVENLQLYNLQAWPNPTNGIVNVSLTLPASGNVTINIYDMAGTLIEIIDSYYVTAGFNTICLDLSDKAAAQYIFEIITDENILRGKIFKN